MRRFIGLVALLSFIAVGALAQSRSYETLRNKFKGKEGVHSFSIGGILLRATLGIVAHDEDPLRQSMRNVSHVRFMVIPEDAFAEEKVSVNGFKSYLKNDSYDQVAEIKDKGERITIFHRAEGNRDGRYFVLVEDNGEVVAMEIKGDMDLSVWNSEMKKGNSL